MIKQRKSFMENKILLIFFVLIASISQATDDISNTLLIGLDADISSGSARSGESIRRGAIIAIDEVNAQGGLLGKQLKLEVRDHRGIPARGVANIEYFSSKKNLLAVLGGLHTPVALRELPTIHKNKVIYLVPWAAGTTIVENGYKPNYVFRASVSDQFAGGFLVKKAVEQGYKEIGLLLERTGWGRSNEKAMTSALKKEGLLPTAIEWFRWGSNIEKMSQHINKLKFSGAEVILLVSNAPEGATLIRAMAQRLETDRLPVISHWGITGGDFFEKTKDILGLVKLQFLQTYSFFEPGNKEYAKQFLSAYCQRFNACQGAKAVFSPVGSAHAYDLIHLLVKAAKIAGTPESSQVHTALEQIDYHSGLVREYQPPFTTNNHDALDLSDFRLAHYNSEGIIVP